MDVVTTFSRGSLDEKLYEYILDAIISVLRSRFFCKVKISLNGLEQSPHKCNNKMNNFLVKTINVQAFSADPFFSSRFLDGSNLFLTLYEDDLLIAASMDQSWIIGVVRGRFEAKDLGEGKVCPCIENRTDCNCEQLFLTQHSCIRRSSRAIWNEHF